MKTYEFSAETRAFIENIPIPMAVYQYIEDQIKPLLVSRAYLAFFGYDSFQEAIYSLGINLYRNVHPDDIARMEESSYRFAAGDGVYDIVFRNRREDQSEYHVIHGTGRYNDRWNKHGLHHLHGRDLGCGQRPIRQGGADHALRQGFRLGEYGVLQEL